MTVLLTSLEPFARRARSLRDGRHERCEVCGAAIDDAHRHVVDRTDRKLLCACTSCVLAFDTPADLVRARFRAVPDRVRVPLDALTDDELSALGVPVGLAFFFRPSNVGRWIGVFPSPAGPTEAELPEDAWAALEQRHSFLAGIDEDVEALLVRRTRDGRSASFVVPIDACYELTALLRRSWRGIDGGDEARSAVDAFFAHLAERAERAERATRDTARGGTP